MKYIFICFTYIIVFQNINAQITNQKVIDFFEEIMPHELSNRAERGNGSEIQEAVFDETLAPFYHGVASGDPLNDKVIIWTRITPENDGEIIGKYFVCRDTAMLDLVTQGEFLTNSDKDYTVKIDIENLEPATTYYYMFEVDGVYSLRGRTRTAPVGDSDHLRFGIVSCSNYQAGYFNVYNKLSQYNDLDAILHLGDYIYEYGSTGYGGFNEERPHEPENEILTLTDYRSRYSFYRLDKDLRGLHQQFPFINIWDDHETANDAYVDGAQNHDEVTEGNWEERKAAARQAYFEWIPIRGTQDDKIYRYIDYGNLLDLVMLDTRMEGRDEQLEEIDPDILYSEERTILGEEQKEWFLNKLTESEAQWKVVSNQVIFSPFALGSLSSFKQFFNDVWEAYPIERNNITQYFADNDIENIVVLTGDFHCSMAANVPLADVDYETNDAIILDGDYVAVEFMVPSVTSANFDEALGSPIIAENISNLALIENPHIEMFDLVNHGYYILDVTPEKAQADWYFIDSLYINEATEVLAHSFYTNAGENELQTSETASEPKTEQMLQAPLTPFVENYPANNELVNKDLLMLAIHPNPVTDFFSVNFALNSPQNVSIALYDIQGKLVKNIKVNETLNAGLFDLVVDASSITSGHYLLQISTEKQTVSRKIIVQ